MNSMKARTTIAVFAVLLAGSGTAFAAAAGEAAQPEEVTLNWLGIGPGIQRDAEEVWALFNEELQSYLPGVTVEFDLLPPYEYADRFKLAMAANEQIDVANRMWMMNFFQELDRGALMPLNDLLAEHGQGILDTVPEFALSTVSFGGEIYNIPTSWAADWRPGFRFHEELADKTGMEEKSARIADSELGTQEVYDLLESYLQQAQQDGVLGTGISPTLLSWVWGKGYEGVARGVSIRQDGSDFTLVNIYETDSFRTVIQVAADWFAKGYIRKDYLGTDIQELRKDDGKPLGEGAVVWVHLYDPTKSAEETARYGIPIVVYSGAAQAFVGHSPGPNNLAIPTTAKHPEQAMQLINLLFTERELYFRLTYGIDGKHYANRTEHDFEPIGYTGIQGSEDSPYGLYPWAVGNFQDFILWPPGTDGKEWKERQYAITADARTSPLVGFPKDVSELTTETAQIQAVEREMVDSLLSGALPDWEATYQTFLEKLRAAGVDRVRETLQSQIDAWRAL